MKGHWKDAKLEIGGLRFCCSVTYESTIRSSNLLVFTKLFAVGWLIIISHLCQEFVRHLRRKMYGETASQNETDP